MDLYEVMRTAFAARDFLDEAVPDDTLERILENARFAPSGGNRQGWKVIVVKDPKLREALRPLLEPTMRKYAAQARSGENPFNTVAPSRVSAETIASQELAPGQVERLIHAPLLLLVLVDLSVVASMDQDLDRVGVISGASIYPLVWNILLAARNEGLGGTLTTFLVAEEQKVKELFGIPDRYALGAMLPIGKPKKQLRKLKRKGVHEFATIDSFHGPPVG